jgi:hypothetical protein
LNYLEGIGLIVINITCCGILVVIIDEKVSDGMEGKRHWGSGGGKEGGQFKGHSTRLACGFVVKYG